MNKDKFKDAVIILAFILLIVNFFNIRSLKDELRNDHNRLENNLESRIRNIQYDLQDTYRNMEESLRKEQSIFSYTSVDLELQGNKIEVTIEAVPKKISNTEKLVARVIANDKTYEQDMDEKNQATMTIDMAETIKPVVIIKSDTGLRQESLGELFAGDIFTTKVYSEWSHEKKMILDLWVVPENEQPFIEDDIEKAEFIITNGDIILEQYSDGGYSVPIKESKAISIEQGVEEFFNQLEGDVIPAIKLSKEENFVAGYRADFTEYADRQDDTYYEIYFILTTKDGMQYITSYNPVASFRTSKNSSNASSGEEILRPIFK